jgi:16S rRNA processing protein RimM
MNEIFIAKLGKTVGLKGQLKIHIDTDFPEQFKNGAIFTTHKKKKLQIQTINLTNKIVKFKDIDTIEDAQKYINAQLFTSQEDTKKNCHLTQDQYFWFDLIKCTIIEDDVVLGKIKDIHRYPVDDYFEIETAKELLNEEFKIKTFLIPYNKTYILNVDIENKIITTQGAKEILDNS